MLLTCSRDVPGALEMLSQIQLCVDFEPCAHRLSFLQTASLTALPAALRSVVTQDRIKFLPACCVCAMPMHSDRQALRREQQAFSRVGSMPDHPSK